MTFKAYRLTFKVRSVDGSRVATVPVTDGYSNPAESADMVNRARAGAAAMLAAKCPGVEWQRPELVRTDWAQ